MFSGKEKPKHEYMLETELERVITVLKTESPTSEEYPKMLTSAERLHTLLPPQRQAPMSRETLVTVGANLLGILLIIRHEDVNVITSKALGFVLRVR